MRFRGWGKRMREKAALACRALCRARVAEELQRGRGTYPPPSAQAKRVPSRCEPRSRATNRSLWGLHCRKGVPPPGTPGGERTHLLPGADQLAHFVYRLEAAEDRCLKERTRRAIRSTSSLPLRSSGSYFSNEVFSDARFCRIVPQILPVHLAKRSSAPCRHGS